MKKDSRVKAGSPQGWCALRLFSNLYSIVRQLPFISLLGRDCNHAHALRHSPSSQPKFKLRRFIMISAQTWRIDNIEQVMEKVRQSTLLYHRGAIRRLHTLRMFTV